MCIGRLRHRGLSRHGEHSPAHKVTGIDYVCPIRLGLEGRRLAIVCVGDLRQRIAFVRTRNEAHLLTGRQGHLSRGGSNYLVVVLKIGVVERERELDVLALLAPLNRLHFRIRSRLGGTGINYLDRGVGLRRGGDRIFLSLRVQRGRVLGSRLLGDRRGRLLHALCRIAKWGLRGHHRDREEHDQRFAHALTNASVLHVDLPSQSHL